MAIEDIKTLWVWFIPLIWVTIGKQSNTMGGGGETSTEVNTIEIPSVEITLRDSTQFYK